ncbi:cationic amino acid transporter 2, vacuolar [Trifolium repens]|nr:cationic amino acid transporter 2, vacuolar [Trifolium repens]
MLGISEALLGDDDNNINECMYIVIVAGGYIGFMSGWVGYELPTGHFPFGVDGMLPGSTTVFFAYVGFGAVAALPKRFV